MLPIQQPIVKIKKLDEDELAALKKRVDVATTIIIIFIAVLIARLWFLQIHNGSKYEKMAENNRVRILDIVAPRGNILDRNDRILVTNRPSFNIIWTKEDAPDPDGVLKRLAHIMSKEMTYLIQKIRASADNPRHVPIRIEEDIGWQMLAYVENSRFKLPGISIEVLPRRDYLFNNLSSHIVGYLGEINKNELNKLRWDNYEIGDQIGKTGLEKLYEQSLKGEKGRHYMEVDARGFEQRRLKGQKPLPGNDIRLNIDLALQQTAEKAIEGRAGAVVAMEVNTGRILALASSPPLKLEEFVGGISSKSWKSLLDNPLHPLVNKSIMGQYPPGSTYKIVSALAALSEKVINTESVLYCAGSLSFGNRRYGCWKKSGHGAVNLKKALAESCDVYFYQVGQKLGVDTLARYAKSMGLGNKTGIELQNEKGGLVPTSAWKERKHKEPWQKGETMSVVIGQGFNLTTPLQIAQMTAATVNGGILYRPQLINAVIDPDGNIIEEFSPVVEGKVSASKRTLLFVRKALVAAVNDKHGTGGAAKMENITVGGKTGTAQVVRLAHLKGIPEEKIPYKYRDHAWFTSFAPAEKPEIAVTVLVEHGMHGGSEAGPIAKEVMTKYFNRETETEQPALMSGL